MSTMDPKYGKIVRISREAADLLDDIKQAFPRQEGFKPITDTELLTLAVKALQKQEEQRWKKKCGEK